MKLGDQQYFDGTYRFNIIEFYLFSNFCVTEEFTFIHGLSQTIPSIKKRFSTLLHKIGYV